MKSVGEVMGIGRTLQESLMKAVLSLEYHPQGFPQIEVLIDKISYPNSQRIFHLYPALREGQSVKDLQELTQIEPWFLEQLLQLTQFEKELSAAPELSPELLLQAKKKGFSDALIGALCGTSDSRVRELRERCSLFPSYQQVDTCAGEFASSTPYYYST